MNFLLDFFASFAFYIIPLLVGYIATYRFSKIRGIITSFCLGALIIFVSTAIILSIANFLNLPSLGVNILHYILLSIPLIALALFVRNIKAYFIESLISYQNKKSDIYTISIILIFTSITYFFTWKSQTPHPLSLNWDIFEHITVANKISSGSFSLLPSYISDTFTFNGYTTLFHTLLALPSIIFKTSLYGVYWWLEYWHYLFTTIIIYWGSLYLFKDRGVALVSALISSLIFESNIVYSTLFLIPQTLVALIGFGSAINLAKMHDNIHQTVYKLIQLLIVSVFLLLTHFIVGAVAILLLTALIFYLYKVTSKNLTAVLCVLTILLFAGSAATGLNKLIILTGREEAIHFSLSLLEKIEMFFNWYGLSIFLILPLGVYAIYRYASNRTLLFAPVFAIILLALAFAPFSYSLKFYVLGRYWVHIILASGIWFLLSNLPKKLSLIAGVALILAFYIVFYFNQLSYKSNLYYQGYSSHTSINEVKAALWLKKYYAKQNVLLISDPATMYVFEAISGLNTQGGAYTNQETRSKLIELHKLPDFSQIKERILEVQDTLPHEQIESKHLFIVSGRYLVWQSYPENWKNSFFYNVWKPQEIDLSKMSFVNFLSINPYFKIVYQNNELIIFEIRK